MTSQDFNELLNSLNRLTEAVEGKKDNGEGEIVSVLDDIRNELRNITGELRDISEVINEK